MRERVLSLILILTAVGRGLNLRIYNHNIVPATPTSNPIPESETSSLEDYFLKYSGGYYKYNVNVAQSASGVVDDDESGDTALPAAESPSFVESMVTLQKMAGLTPNGEVTDETIRTINQPRCGVPDPVLDPNAPGEYRVNTMWKSKYDPSTQLYFVTYSIHQDGIPEDTEFADIEQGLTSAMCSWEQISNIRFQNVGVDKSDADIKVGFAKGNHGDGYAFDGKGSTLAHAFYPADGRLHFDSDEPWHLAKQNEVEPDKKDIYTVALHELGHTIGLLHSEAESSIMRAFYKYYGVFDSFDIPIDDWQGVAKMYGARINADPSAEAIGACRELKDRFNVAVAYKPAPADATKAHFEEFDEVDMNCEDGDEFKSRCPGWKKLFLCERPYSIGTMKRRCPKTCGFCPGPIPRTKDPDKIANLVSSICDIRQFDSISTVYDEADGFFAYAFKDDHYFQSKVIFSTANGSRPSLLNDTESILGAYKWIDDPKTFTPGFFRIQSPEFLDMSRKVDALLIIGTRYLAFDGNMVQVYSRNTPLILFENEFALGDLFPGYPRQKVDAAFVELGELRQNPTYSLFYKDKLWQFQAEQGAKIENGFDASPFISIPDRADIEIAQWHGVHACHVDSVFSYQGVPYFLKGNTFWPAVDEEPQVARDITYNLFRCWQEEPQITLIPSTCDETSPGNSAGKGNFARYSNYIVVFSISISFFLSFFKT